MCKNITIFSIIICKEESISAPKIITFLPNPIAVNPKVPYISNPIPYPECLYVSVSAFFTDLTAPNKDFLDHYFIHSSTNLFHK